ncbi:2-dehydropantoate 2-reductase [Pelagicoccus sp. SDUM812003]|uniref:2-dehydropantoate 2-reductase n=1 Tax=Pelagicoccus sp. SDUM812003 TaxID=3041267 RepID=UPI00280EA0AB|nr:2-dehydropantoate 2-reductase [Pelagicoccus sp. SDUM812003]MDQ8203150.1 2-dehydropantoate 2-reductase [Pelagicoccus sp. SDUM812003]
MKIAIVGSGAIGLYYGAMLQRAGHELHFLFRSDYEAARRDGVRIVTPSEEFQLEVNAHRDTGSIGICDLVVIALKATSNYALADLLPPLVGEKTQLLTLQNGLGNDRLLGELFPRNSVFGGLCFVCLNRIAPAAAQNFMPGSVSIGAYRQRGDGEVEALGKAFEAAGVKTRVEANLALVQWKKLVWNVPFNGLTVAAGGVTTDVIVQSKELLEEARALMLEVISAAGALGLEIDSSFANKQIDVTIPMKAYKPSSMIDFVEGRAVEVEAIWGEPLRRGQEAGVSMPKLELLHGLLACICK